MNQQIILENGALFDVQTCYSSAVLNPGPWITDGKGRIGQQYESIIYDQFGKIIRREMLEPVCWLSFS